MAPPFVPHRVVEQRGYRIELDLSSRVLSLGPLEFVPTLRWVAEPVFAELYVSRLLGRNEFRAHCDRCGSVESILAHLA